MFKRVFQCFFYNHEDYQVVFEFDPYFCARIGIFITSWVSYFDPNKLSMTRTTILIKILDLPLHFWGAQSLEAIGNSIWMFLKIDIDKAKSRISYLYSYLCGG